MPEPLTLTEVGVDYVVNAEDLQKSFGELKAVDGISFKVRRGECFGFLGPNGAGKTTTMKMIYCVSKPTGGKLTVLDHDVTKEPRRVKQRLGVIAQDNNLDPDLTVFENLVIFAGYFGIDRFHAQAKAHELIEYADLKEKADTKVDKLSGGMKRKLMIVRGLVNTPSLLVLDEPTTGLDPAARLGIWNMLRELQQKQKVTLLLTTHYMEEAHRLCNRLAFIDHGKVISIGEPQEVIKQQVGDWMVELNVTLHEYVLRDIKDMLVTYRRENGYTYLYGNQGQELLDKIKAHPETTLGDSITVRRTTLEDVFVNLTGNRLGVQS